MRLTDIANPAGIQEILQHRKFNNAKVWLGYARLSIHVNLPRSEAFKILRYTPCK